MVVFSPVFAVSSNCGTRCAAIEQLSSKVSSIHDRRNTVMEGSQISLDAASGSYMALNISIKHSTVALGSGTLGATPAGRR